MRPLQVDPDVCAARPGCLGAPPADCSAVPPSPGAPQLKKGVAVAALRAPLPTQRRYGIHTPGDSVEEIRSNVKEAVDCYFDDTMPRPKLIRLHFVRDPFAKLICNFKIASKPRQVRSITETSAACRLTTSWRNASGHGGGGLRGQAAAAAAAPAGARGAARPRTGGGRAGESGLPAAGVHQSVSSIYESTATTVHPAGTWVFRVSSAASARTTDSGSRSITVQQHARGPVRNPAALFPLLHGPHVEAEALCELLPAELQPLAKGSDPAGGRVIHDSAGQRRLTAHMGDDLSQRRLDVLPDPGAFHRHSLCLSCSISATSRASAFLSAAVRSSRSAFA